MDRIKSHGTFLGVFMVLIFSAGPVFSEYSKQPPLDSPSTLHIKKTSKHRPHHRSKKLNNQADPSSADSQEEVTDQREVSQQSDHSETKRK